MTGGRPFFAFQPTDWLVGLYSLGVAAVIVARHGAVPAWGGYAAVHLGVVAAVLLTARTCREDSGPLRRFWRSWDLAAYIIVLFVMSTKLVQRVNPHDVDPMLMAWDRAIGGDRLLRWTMTWSTPLMDEIGKITWVAYFLLPWLPGAALYLRKDPRPFRELKIMLGAAWLAAFSFYYAMPAKGPLHFKEQLGLVDPSCGVAIAGELKVVVSALEGIEARDTFPSGHAMLGALLILLCVRHRLWKTSLLVVPAAAAMVVSTIYLRYHYVVDVLAGLLFCVPIAWIGIAWNRRHGAGAPPGDDRSGAPAGPEV